MSHWALPDVWTPSGAWPENLGFQFHGQNRDQSVAAATAPCAIGRDRQSMANTLPDASPGLGDTMDGSSSSKASPGRQGVAPDVEGSREGGDELAELPLPLQMPPMILVSNRLPFVLKRTDKGTLKRHARSGGRLSLTIFDIKASGYQGRLRDLSLSGGFFPKLVPFFFVYLNLLAFFFWEVCKFFSCSLWILSYFVQLSYCNVTFGPKGAKKFSDAVLLRPLCLDAVKCAIAEVESRGSEGRILLDCKQKGNRRGVVHYRRHGVWGTFAPALAVVPGERSLALPLTIFTK